jgi:Zn-dependent protease/CBS domain-containing protein
MDQNLRLGRIAGIPVGLNWSVLFVFALLAWELAGLVLPHDQPGHPVALYWIAGTVATILFFASLLAHEAAHALVAKHHGIAVRRITLWLFGGVSELEGEALTPGTEFRVAVVGPLTSLAVAVAAGGCSLLLHDGSGAAPVVAAALGWLAWINLLLAGFNLIPAAPLDGGRILRAVLWHRSGDRVRATTTATRCGVAFGYALIVLGVLECLTVGVLGLWFVFLGWFLLSAARAEQTDMLLRSSLGDATVAGLMTADPVTFPASGTVAELVDRRLHHFRFSTYPLVSPDGRLVGLTTLSRIRHVPPDHRSATRLVDTAVPLADVPIAAPDEPVATLLQRMQSSPDGRALVVDGAGRLVGIVSPSDIARYVQVAMVDRRGRAGTAH